MVQREVLNLGLSGRKGDGHAHRANEPNHKNTHSEPTSLASSNPGTASTSVNTRSRTRSERQVEHEMSVLSVFVESVNLVLQAFDSSRWTTNNNGLNKKKGEDDTYHQSTSLVNNNNNDNNNNNNNNNNKLHSRKWTTLSQEDDASYLHPFLERITSSTSSSFSPSTSPIHKNRHQCVYHNDFSRDVETATASSATNNSSNDECFRENFAFLRKLQKLIYVLGLELGFLAQGSTVGVQYVATQYIPTRVARLVFSLIWSYVLAAMALLVFFLCQNVVRIFLRELLKLYSERHHHQHHHHHQQQPTNNHDHDDNSNDDEITKAAQEYRTQCEDMILEEWKVEIQCQFVQGSVVGVFFSWLFVDVIMNFQIQVIYGGIMLLLSLFFFMVQIWFQQHRHTNFYNPPRNCNYDKSTSNTTSPTVTITV